MAVFEANQALDMDTYAIYFGPIRSSSETDFSVRVGAVTFNFIGTFTYDEDGNPSGTLTEMERTYFGHFVEWSVTGISVDVEDVIEFMENRDAVGFFELLLGDSDTITGSDENDVLYAHNGGDYVDGGAGADTIYGGRNGDTLVGGDGNDMLDGEGGADEIDGGAGADTIYGGAGRDTISAGDDDDLVDGGSGGDEIDAGDGSDVVQAGKGRDTVSGGNGGDEIYGEGGVDTILGGRGGDTIFGGGGRDDINGGQGNDLIEGGNMGDTFRFTAFDADHDTIVDFEADRDALFFDLAGQSADTVTIEQDGGNTVITFGAAEETVTLLDVSLDFGDFDITFI